MEIPDSPRSAVAIEITEFIEFTEFTELIQHFKDDRAVAGSLI